MRISVRAEAESILIELHVVYCSASWDSFALPLNSVPVLVDESLRDIDCSAHLDWHTSYLIA